MSGPFMIAVYCDDEKDTITHDMTTGRGFFLWLRGSASAVDVAVRYGATQRPRWAVLR